MESKKVKVVIPCYHEQLTKNELISLMQCKRILYNYPLCIVKPNGLCIQTMEVQGMEIEEFDKEWFQSVQSYNDLMLTQQFYQRFCDYEYILIYQLDAFVFRDELSTFCAMGYDYVGAPWLYGQFIYVNGNGGYYYVGNGGLSLRKVKSHLKILRKTEIYDIVNEDMFFSSRESNEFRIAPLEVALSFAFEATVRKCYERNNSKLPFGCHAWQKYDFTFYRQIFQEFGYDTDDIEDEMYDRNKYNNFCDLSLVSEEVIRRTLQEILPDALNGVWIWGAGQIGKECGWLLEKNHISVKGFIDKSSGLHGKKLFGQKIEAVEKYFEKKEKNALIIAMANVPDEVEEHLYRHRRQMGRDYISWGELRGRFSMKRGVK